ncbi:hypothetical protein FIBSPDRAFT_799057 [Athelia psychrophila]|uniref:G domain-containing protein n=1 Tax=Athelia psychrophila TaxID=1759441 RepID=A0A166B639_9AGAM|nr:hypothetical protein FIBSPDRAFT_799057 [Fibularhizoctonia sp. CBS 109695]
MRAPARTPVEPGLESLREPPALPLKAVPLQTAFDTFRQPPREPPSQNQHSLISPEIGPIEVDLVPSELDESSAIEREILIEGPGADSVAEHAPRGQGEHTIATQISPQNIALADAPEEGPTGEYNPQLQGEHTTAAHISPPNIIVFGATGAGKSSIVNMIADEVVAITSSDATGCTFQSQPYPVEIEGSKFVLWDTSGLNEGDKGRVPAEQAVENLYTLARGLGEGVSLLIYCVRGPRINANTADNYDLFFRGLCQEKVPIILVVTALEGVTSTEEWWLENEPTYREQGMEFDNHACVVATKGKKRGGKYLFETEYNASQVDLRALLCSTLKQSPLPWRIEVNGWLGAISNVVCRAMGIGPTAFSHVVRQLQRPTLSVDTTSNDRSSSPGGRQSDRNPQLSQGIIAIIKNFIIDYCAPSGPTKSSQVQTWQSHYDKSQPAESHDGVLTM